MNSASSGLYPTIPLEEFTNAPIDTRGDSTLDSINVAYEVSLLSKPFPILLVGRANEFYSRETSLG